MKLWVGGPVNEVDRDVTGHSRVAIFAETESDAQDLMGRLLPYRCTVAEVELPDSAQEALDEVRAGLFAELR